MSGLALDLVGGIELSRFFSNQNLIETFRFKVCGWQTATEHHSMLITLIASIALSGARGPKAGKKLVFSYDFSKQTQISPQDWRFNNGPVYNHELEKYTSNNTEIKDGSLVIEARKENGQITSARLETVKSWKYGYFESTERVPPGRGTWPAFWMLNDRLRHPGQADYVGWPKCGEIDIMENVGFDPDKFHFSLHSQDFNFMQKNQRTEITPVSDPNAFHKFGLDWRADRITFYLDDKPVYTVDKTVDTVDNWPFRDPFYIILNLAIGGDWGGAKGVADSTLPADFYVKDVKVYQ
jgi:beta-glucanase (GH16 family)